MRRFLLVNNLETSSVATEDINHLVREAGVYTGDAALPAAETENQPQKRSLQRLVRQVYEVSSATTDHPAVSETEKPKAAAEKVADLPTNEENN